MECNDMMCDLVDGERKKKTCSDNFCNYRMEFEGGGITTGNMVEDVLRLNTVIENGQTSPVSAGFVFGYVHIYNLLVQFIRKSSIDSEF